MKKSAVRNIGIQFEKDLAAVLSADGRKTMDYRKNIRYFKSSDAHFYVGIPIVIIGIILFVIGQFFWIYFIPYQSMTALLAVLAGAAVAWIPRWRRSDEKELDDYIASKKEDHVKKAEERLGLSSSLMPGREPIVIGGCDFDSGDVLYRRGKDDRKYRSSLYTSSVLFLTKNGICAVQKSFSLTEDLEHETVKEIPYCDIDDAKIICEEKTVGADKIKYFCFVIAANGAELLRVPAAQDAVLEGICEDIRTAAVKAKA